MMIDSKDTRTRYMVEISINGNTEWYRVINGFCLGLRVAEYSDHGKVTPDVMRGFCKFLAVKTDAPTSTEWSLMQFRGMQRAGSSDEEFNNYYCDYYIDFPDPPLPDNPFQFFES